MKLFGFFSLPLILGVLLWTGLIFFLGWEQNEINRELIFSLAEVEAQASFNKDLVYRRWAAKQGGIYVKPSEKTPPNPHLAHLPERDALTTSGQELTLVNPAYMTRQVHELGQEQYGVKGHITSLNPLRPQNSPDPWERESLEAFRDDLPVVKTFASLEGARVLRMMYPMITEAPCLKCHGHQGYQIGDIRGGISVSVPLAPYEQRYAQSFQTILWSKGAIWLVGILCIFWAQRHWSLLYRDQSRARQSAEDSEGRYRLLFDEAAVGLGLAEEGSGKLIRCNRVLADMVGRSAQELVGQSQKILHPAEQNDSDFSKEFADHRALPDGAIIESQLLRSDGRVREVEIKANRLVLNDTAMILGSFRDITERKQAEQALRLERERLASIIQGANVGTWEWNVQTGETTLNERWAQMVGYSLEELLPTSFQTWSDLAHPGDFATSEALLEKHFSGELDYYECECRMKHKQGHWIWVHVLGKVIAWSKDKEPLLMVGTHSDITSRLQTMEDLKKANAELAKATLLAKQMTAKAESANEAKSEFLANMSHEIRTPLNGLLGMLQIVQDTSLTENQAHAIGIALESGRKLLRVLNDILDFSRIEAGRLELTETSYCPSRTLEEVVEIFAEGAKNKHNRLSYTLCPSVPDRVIGDEARLRQILFNLVGNAVKFTEEGEISIEARSHPAELPERVVLSFCVSDTGTGIPEDKLDAVFEPFTQIDGTHTRKHSGTGLGLGIVKRLVNLMGGDVLIESQVNQGTQVRFTLQVKTAPSQEALSTQQRFTDLEVSLAPLKILVAEDERVNLMVLEKILKKQGHTVSAATNGKMCLQELEKQSYDVIFMDIQMPEMDGLEATRHIRSRSDGLRDIPIVALTAHAMKGDREKFLAAGMNDYLSKPVEVEAIQSTLGSLFNGGCD